jgi:hypothetical protein
MPEQLHLLNSRLDFNSENDSFQIQDPQTDDVRVKKPEWLVLLGNCFVKMIRLF